MQTKLTRLVLVTCAALLGIMVLQFFWLLKAYREQKMQLLTLVDNTLMETQIFTGVNAGLQHTAKSLVGDLLSDMHKLKSDSGRGDTLFKYVVDVSEIKMDSIDKNMVAAFLQQDSMKSKHYTLATYKHELEKSLAFKGVKIPFEMALLNAGNNTIACTTDTARFNAVSLKTNTNFSLPITLNDTLKGRAQLAFPGAKFYLLRGMWVILALTICLIFICALSFVYMVILFYRQKRLAEVKNDFMNNMTHELKTPISSVSLALELLRDHSVTMGKEAQEEYLGIAGNELKRLTMLVDKVLRIAAFEKTDVKIKKEHIPVYNWIYQTVQSVKPLIESKNVVTDIHVVPEGLSLFADKIHITSVLQNLLENAIKYADPNKRILHIDIDVTDQNDACVLKITDNGNGIDRLYHTKVFDKFFRVPTGDEHDTKGYGLGLSYVKEIVRLHEGTIVLESELKVGSSFIITIPKAQ